MNGDWAYLSELDLSTKIDLEENRNDFGVLPFLPPEFLRNKLYTQSSDIYSIGIVMSEIASGDVPFQDGQEDVSLVLSICYGLRPKIKESTPEAYRKIMQACWDSDPLKRPDIFKLQTIFTKWRQNPPFNITRQFEQADALDIKNNDTGNINSIFIHISSVIIIYCAS